MALNPGSERGSRIEETLGLDNQVPARKRAIAWIVAAFVATGMIVGTALSALQEQALLAYQLATSEGGGKTNLVGLCNSFGADGRLSRSVKIPHRRLHKYLREPGHI
jgi:hypothetical protein